MTYPRSSMSAAATARSLRSWSRSASKPIGRTALPASDVHRAMARQQRVITVSREACQRNLRIAREAESRFKDHDVLGLLWLIGPRGSSTAQRFFCLPGPPERQQRLRPLEVGASEHVRVAGTGRDVEVFLEEFQGLLEAARIDVGPGQIDEHEAERDVRSRVLKVEDDVPEQQVAEVQPRRQTPRRCWRLARASRPRPMSAATTQPARTSLSMLAVVADADAGANSRGVWGREPVRRCTTCVA